MRVHIFPEDGDRSWTKGMYKAINGVMNRTIYKNNLHKQMNKAFMDNLVYGGFIETTHTADGRVVCKNVSSRELYLGEKAINPTKID